MALLYRYDSNLSQIRLIVVAGEDLVEWKKARDVLPEQMKHELSEGSGLRAGKSSPWCPAFVVLCITDFQLKRGLEDKS